MSVPVFKNLSFYSDPHSNETRYQEVVKTFSVNFPDDSIHFLLDLQEEST